MIAVWDGIVRKYNDLKLYQRNVASCSRSNIDLFANYGGIADSAASFLKNSDCSFLFRHHRRQSPMKLLPFFIGVFTSIASVHADATVIDYDKVQPFAEPEPVTDAEKAAVKFKPQLTFVHGCIPYPAVDADGAVSGNTGDSDCVTLTVGSQVYSRADWYDDKWAIMYAWYLPSELSKPQWKWAIIWIDDPALESSTVLGVSTPALIGYDKHAPPEDQYLNGTSLKLGVYVDFMAGTARLMLTADPGEQQDLIQWDQLTDAARDSLNTFDFDSSFWAMGDIECPLKDDVFAKNLKKSSPF